MRPLRAILGRSPSLFRDDLLRAHPHLDRAIAGRRFLIIGAAGTIGASVVKKLLPYHPRAVHLVDLSENGLVELVRDLRSSTVSLPADFKTLSIDFGGVEFLRFLDSQPAYDVVINAAALKHVRAERDVFTLSRMIDVNVLQVERLMQALRRRPPRLFLAVSSDKAVNPVSLMGATKRLMERLLLLGSEKTAVVAVRCANVAYSAGSLLDGFERRLQKKQPLSGPSDVRRYFVSEEEAGEFCLLACAMGRHREIWVPKVRPANDLRTFRDLAITILRARGLKPRFYSSDAEAKAAAARLTDKPRVWPCYFSPSDTAGEKEREEFVGRGEHPRAGPARQVRVIAQSRLSTKEAARVRQTIAALRRLRTKSIWLRADIVRALGLAVPGLWAAASRRSLDEKM